MCYRDCTKAAIGEIFFDGNDRRSFKKREGLFGRNEGHFSDINAFTYTQNHGLAARLRQQLWIAQDSAAGVR